MLTLVVCDLTLLRPIVCASGTPCIDNRGQHPENCPACWWAQHGRKGLIPVILLQIMVLSQVLEANGIEPAFVLSNAEAEPSEEAFSGSDDEEEQEEGDEPEVPSVASSAGEDAVPGEEEEE